MICHNHTIDQSFWLTELKEEEPRDAEEQEAEQQRSLRSLLGASGVERSRASGGGPAESAASDDQTQTKLTERC